MADTPDQDQVVKLANIAEHFKQASEAGLTNDPASVQKVRAAFTPQSVQKIQGLMQEFMEAVMNSPHYEAAAAGGDPTELKKDVAPQAIVLVDALAEALNTSFTDDELSEFIAEEDRTEENAAGFRQYNAPTLAKLCAKP